MMDATHILLVDKAIGREYRRVSRSPHGLQSDNNVFQTKMGLQNNHVQFQWLAVEALNGPSLLRESFR